MKKTLLLILIIPLFAAACSSPAPEPGPINTNEAPNLGRDIASDYAVSTDEEANLLRLAEQELDDERFILFQSDYEQLKDTFEEGYFVITKVGARAPQEINTYYDTSITDRGSRMNLLIHELTHVASDRCFVKNLRPAECELSFFDQQKYTFQKDQLFLTVNYDEEILHKKDALRQYIPETNEIDKTYLNAENGDIFGTLDELNAYTKSMRAQIAYQDIDSREQLIFEYLNLNRQLFHLALDLHHAKNTSEDEWQFLTSDPGIGYIVFNFKKDAEKELSRVNINGEDSTDPIIQEIKNTNILLAEYESIFDTFLEESVIKEGEKELSYTDINLGKISVINEPVQ